jgi:hypothetical protein
VLICGEKSWNWGALLLLFGIEEFVVENTKGKGKRFFFKYNIS